MYQYLAQLLDDISAGGFSMWNSYTFASLASFYQVVEYLLET